MIWCFYLYVDYSRSADRYTKKKEKLDGLPEAVSTNDKNMFIDITNITVVVAITVSLCYAV
jgi:hypothetical protein